MGIGDRPNVNMLSNERYRIIKKIGEGGMGEVFHAYDIINSEEVALKRVTLSEFIDALDSFQIEEYNLSIAKEFQHLSGLRHPNIIHVKDFGFDVNQEPFFTMEYLSNAESIVKDVKQKTLEEKLQLIEQLFQALIYLHRHKILHRDLKPANILVSEEKVFVLDFGLAARLDQPHIFGGSPMYMAPELLVSNDPTFSPASDIYALGIVLYQILVGELPFLSNGPIDSRHINLEDVQLNLPKSLRSLGSFFERILNSDWHERFMSVEEVLQEFYGVFERPLPLETQEIRESFIQAAEFVGRQNELELFVKNLGLLDEGQGGSWLIGGQSGVGKSRFIQEIRLKARVKGCLVLEAEAIRETNVPYAFWKNIYQHLIMLTDFEPIPAEIISPLVSSLDHLDQDKISNTPINVSAEQAHNQRINLLLQLLQAQDQPVVLFMEDLHWAEQEIPIIQQLIKLAMTHPIMIVASCRIDEAPHLPQLLSAMNHVPLDRLNDHDVRELCRSMLGDLGQDIHIVEALQEASEGNTFFLVEIVRELGDRAGRLRDIEKKLLTANLLPRGILSIVEERVKHLTDSDFMIMVAMATAGREIDHQLLEYLLNRYEIRQSSEEWLGKGFELAIFEIQSSRWRFIHDKFRYGILNYVSEDVLQPLAKEVAESIEFLYPKNPLKFGILAHLWGLADDHDKEFRYLWDAATEAKASWQNKNAIDMYTRALEITSGDDWDRKFEILLNREELFSITGQRDEQYEDINALFRITDSQKIDSAPIWFRKASYMLKIGNFGDAIEFAQSTIDLAKQENNQLIIVKGHYLAAEALIRTGEHAAVEAQLDQAVKLAKQINAQPEMAKTYALLGVHYIENNQPEKANHYYQLARKIYERIGDNFGLSSVLSNLSIFGYRQQNHALATQYLHDALRINKQTGDKAGMVRTLTNLAMISAAFGYYQQALSYSSEALVISESIQSSLGIWYNLLHLLEATTYLGMKTQAETYRGRLMQSFDELESPILQLQTLSDIGYFLIVENNINLAKQYLLSAFELLTESKNKSEELEIRLNLAYADHLDGNSSASFQWFMPIVHLIKQEETLIDSLSRPIYAHWVIYLLSHQQFPDLALKHLKLGYSEIQKQVSQMVDDQQVERFIQSVPTYQMIFSAHKLQFQD